MTLRAKQCPSGKSSWAGAFFRAEPLQVNCAQGHGLGRAFPVEAITSFWENLSRESRARSQTGSQPASLSLCPLHLGKLRWSRHHITGHQNHLKTHINKSQVFQTHCNNNARDTVHYHRLWCSEGLRSMSSGKPLNHFLGKPPWTALFGVGTVNANVGMGNEVAGT